MSFQADFYIFILCIFVLVKGEIQSLWDSAGCTPDGLLSPTNVPYFWRTVKNQEEFMQNLQSKIDKRDAMASLSCFGELRSEHSNSYTNSFHLLWECQDASSTCILPPTHALCVRTLRRLHPSATIKLWSTSLDEHALTQLIQDLNIQFSRYDLSYFDDLPSAARIAADGIQQRMQSTEADRARENSFSHWSDLFRAAVLYKEGGVYTDLDSIWVRPITDASPEKSWIPKTPALTKVENEDDAVTLEDKKFFLEGGVMRFDKPQSPFLRTVLETFPEYDQEMAECWACVGPRQLTRTFNAMEDGQPALIDSAKIFGVRDYRTYFDNMHREFDPVIWSEILSSDEVAAHLFTASPQTGIAKGSTIYHLLHAGGVTTAATEDSASWRSVQKERRNLLSSLYYLEYGSAITAETESITFSVTFSGVTDNNFDSKESDIASAIAVVLDSSTGSMQLTSSGNVVQAIVYTDDPDATSAKVNDEMFISDVNALLEDETIIAMSVSTVETGIHDAAIGDGSVIYFYGNAESVTATVTVTDNIDMDSYETQIRNIFMGAFEVPLSAVTATQTGDFTFTVTVSGIITAYAEENLQEVSELISEDIVLPNGSYLGDVQIADPGYTQSTVVVSKPIVTNADNLDALLLSYMIAQESFALESDATPETQLLYSVSGTISCAVRVSWTAAEISASYEERLGDMLINEVLADADENGDGTFSVTSPTYLDASNNETYIESNPNPTIPTVSEECDWTSDGIVVTITTIIQIPDVTHTQMQALTDTAQSRYEDDGFTFISSNIVSFGQQEIGACDMLAECQADYEELYEMLSGAYVNKATESETDALSWWWDFQMGRLLALHGYTIDMDDLREKDNFLYYKVADDTFVNTCVQHNPAWSSPCDSSVGVCAGQVMGNYGFSSQQVIALEAALDQTSKVHPDCPFGCQSLEEDWASEITATATYASANQISSLCVLDNKYYVWTDPLTIVDTCVGFNEVEDALCPLSDYIFCSDIDYDAGSVVYGNVTYQAYSLENALTSENNRHPQCL